MKWISGFFALIFPEVCATCGNNLWKSEEVICRFCEFHLPKTNYHHVADNPVMQIFTGRVPVFFASAFLFFNKGNNVQRMIHLLKYKGRKDIGIFLGRLYGLDLAGVWLNGMPDVIVPVPLHKKKYMKRGYNQSEQFAIGLSDTLKIPVNSHLLLRTRNTETQTRKTRFRRYQNVKEIFEVKEPGTWKNIHILLVDDVITTGATLESCIQSLNSIPGVKVSVVSVAIAKN